MNKALLTALTVFAAADSALAQAPADIPPGLVAWWRAENDALDAVGTNHGTLIQPANFTEGKVGLGMTFGTPGRLAVPHSAALANQQFTIEAWAKPDGPGPNNDAGGNTLIGKQMAQDCNTMLAVNWRATDNRFLFTYGLGTAIVSNNTFPPGSFYHIAASYDGSVFRLHVNGTLQGEHALVKTMTYVAGDDWSIGTNACGINVGYPRTWNGVIDEVAIYNRALSAAEIATIHTAGSAGKDTTKPYFTRTTLPDGITGAPYSFTLAAAVTPGPHTFALTGGSLPPGLTLAANGLISGNPTEDATSSFDVQATSNAGETNTRTFTLRTYGAPQGMVAWWRAETNGEDFVGSNDGVLSGVTFANGKVGQAFNFSAANQNIALPASSSLNVGAGAGFAIACWINPANNAVPYPLIEWTTAGGVIGPRLWLNVNHLGQGGPGTLSFSFTDSSPHFLASSPNLISPGTWHHAAMTYDKPAGMCRLYLNGVEVASRNVGSITAATNTPMILGFRPGWDSYPGMLDEVALFSRTLSAAEIQAIHAAGAAGMNPNKTYFTTVDRLPDGGVGTPYSLQIAAAVTPGPHTFAFTGGTLPPGLDFHSDGLLHGTPTAAGNASFSITATSSLGQTNTRTFSLNVAACLDPAPAGMVAWWRGQDDALDAAGGHQGLLMNNVSFTQGKVGRGFTFGLNGKLFVPHSPSLANQQFTVEAWARPDGPPPGISNDSFGSILIYKASNGDAESLNVLWRATDNRFSFIFGSSSTHRIISTNSFLPGQFYHVAASYDGAVFRLHVNGVLEGQYALIKSIPYNASEGWNIGNCSDSCIAFGYERRWVGVIDELAIYSRALSAAEITDIHSAGTGGKTGALYLTTLPPLNAGQGAPYSQALALAGGTGPYTFSLLSGTLPAGLSLSAAGVISGTPTGFGISDFTVRVTDAETRPAERHYFLKVNARPVLGTIANQPLNEQTQLTAPNPATDADAGDVLTYELLDPPAGAAIDAATGTITWTPTEAQGPGPFTITTRVTDNGTPPLDATNSFTVTVNEVNLAPSLPVQADRPMDELTLLTVNNGGSDVDLPANNLTYTLTEAPAGAAISAAGVITWTPTEAQGPGVFTFTTRVDDNGAPNLFATNTFTVTVNEVNTAPTLPVPTDPVLDELTLLTVTDTASDADLPANGLTYELLTAPAGAVVSAAGVITWTPTEAQGPGSHPFTVQVTDNGTPPLHATHSFTVTVNEVNTAPSLAAQDDRTVDELTALTVLNPATDADAPANALTYELVNPPAGAAIDVAGTITWTPAEAQGPGPFTLTTKVTDNGTPPLSVTNTFTVTVNEVNTAPSLTAQDDRTIAEQTLLTVNDAATDTDLPANALSYALLAAPAGAAISAAGVITWTPAESQGPGAHLFTVRVTDNGTPPLQATHSFTVNVSEVNTAPSLTAQNDRTIDELTLLTVNNAGSDSDLPANGLTYTLTEAPPGAVISNAGVITWTPTEAQGPGVFTFTTRVDDNGTPNLSATNTFTVTVNEANTAPSLPAQADRPVDELTLLTLANPATDADLPANSLTYELVNPPDGAAIDAAGTITWTPTEAQGPGVFTLTTKVTDNGTPPLSITNSFSVTVGEVNQAPVLQAIADIPIGAGQRISFTAAAADADLPANGKTFSLVNAPAGAAIDPVSGAFTWRPGVALAGTAHVIEVRVTDNGTPALSGSESFAVTVAPFGEVALSWIGLAGNDVLLQLDGPVGPDYTVQVSADLINWSDLTTVTPAAMPVEISDTTPNGGRRRYYKVLTGP
jgi:hypothetical protein